MTTAKDLRHLLKRLDAEISTLEGERSSANDRLMELLSPFQVGQMIKWNGGRRGRIEKIQEWCCGSPMWIVLRIKKDGSDGLLCRVHEYDRPVLDNSTVKDEAK